MVLVEGARRDQGAVGELDRVLRARVGEGRQDGALRPLGGLLGRGDGHPVRAHDEHPKGVAGSEGDGLGRAPHHGRLLGDDQHHGAAAVLSSRRCGVERPGVVLVGIDRALHLEDHDEHGSPFDPQHHHEVGVELGESELAKGPVHHVRRGFPRKRDGQRGQQRRHHVGRSAKQLHDELVVEGGHGPALSESRSRGVEPIFPNRSRARGWRTPKLAWRSPPW
jgi:hypothetical protein